jgi:hypothetical protein
MLGELYAESGDAAGAPLDQNRLARFWSRTTGWQSAGSNGRSEFVYDKSVAHAFESPKFPREKYSFKRRRRDPQLTKLRLRGRFVGTEVAFPCS